MKPPNNDPSRNATGTATPQTGQGTPAQPTPAKPGEPAVTPAAKPSPNAPEPGKVSSTPELAKPDALKTGSPAGPIVKPDTLKDAASASKPDATSAMSSKPDLAKTEPLKSEPQKSGAPDPLKGTGTPPGRAEPTKSEAPKTEALKAEASKSDPSKSDSAKGANFASGPQTGARAAEGPSDGPIIDLKARRIPDPAETARREAAEKAAGPSATGPKTPPSAATGTASTAGKAPLSGTGTSSADRPLSGPVKRGGAGFGSVAAAGLIGGVLGAGLLFAVERAGILPGQSGDLGARLDTLDQKVGTLASRDALASLDTRVAANEAALKPLPEAVRGAETAAREALQRSGAAPTAGTDAPAMAAAVPADLAARLDSLDQRVAALQEEPGRDQSVDAKAPLTQGGAGTEPVAKLDERLKAVEGKIDGMTKPGDAADASAGLGAKLTALQGDVESRTKANAETAQALSQKLASLQASLDERVKAATEAVQTATEASRQSVEANKTQAEEAAKAVARQIQAQSDKIAGLDKAVSERAETGTVQAALRVVSADRIATALSTGAPYADALTSLRNLEPGDPARFSAVAVFADRGAPTARTLAAEFRPIAERIAASRKSAQARSVAETGDISQRLMSMADSIIQVRKVAEPAAEKAAQGADPIAEVQAALDRGAIGDAAKAFAALPEAARVEAGEFGTKLTSRAAAGEAAQALLSDAFKSLSAPAPTR